MKTEDLLTEITPLASSADTLVAAARQQTRQRKVIRATATTAVLVAIGLMAIPRKTPSPSPSPILTKTPPTSNHVRNLSETEFLDSFGDQPIALVTYPDGTKQLLTIVRQ